ncbi:MAG: bifunctional ornithine acetyltransferase/N-acetylglutamate synthase, partial [Planctomycetota bacterium]
ADRAAARAIMTTDLAPKHARHTFKIGSKKVTIGGVAKGSGMIAPNMATMLGFITTDTNITAPLLRAALKEAVNADASFNRLSVDTDTSPSDTVVVMASGLAGHAPIKSKNSTAYRTFGKALTLVCQDLAYQIIADGEGVEHVIRVIVKGAKNDKDAVRIGRAVADSPLVKTAVHGGDPNWGRLTMAVGKSGAAVEAKKLTVKIGDVPVYRKGRPVKADLKQLEKLMRAQEVTFTIDLALGKASTEVLGCDLSREYITINADYHT